MEVYTDHTISGKIKESFSRIDTKVIASVMAIELSMLLMAVSKGLGQNFLPVTLVMMLFSIIACVLSFQIKADHILTVIVLLLLNTGFLVQQIQSGAEGTAGSFMIKMLIAFGAGIIGTAVYAAIRGWMTEYFIIAGMMILQYIICAVMVIYGQLIGSPESQGATIELNGITPFELVKVLYVFTAAGLVTSGDKVSSEDETKIKYKGEVLLFIHTFILSLFFVICSELGTLLIIYSIGMITLWMFGGRRKLAKTLMILSVAGFAGFWALSDRILLPMISSGQNSLPGVVVKIACRFGSALHPELYSSSAGYQSVRGLEAIVMGGLFGIETERYRMPLPESVNDFIFDNVVQTCGIVMGIIVIILFFALLGRGRKISEKCSDRYYSGLSFIITSVITLQAIIHIGYNLSMLPVTGIPLYFVSQGFTALTTGMVLIGVLLVISADNAARMEEEAWVPED